MDKVLDTASYGISLFSLGILDKFLKEKRIITKELLDYFQDNHDIYIEMISKGIWLPCVGINSVEYVLKLDGYDESFSSDWEEKFKYDNFNMDVIDYLWITDIGKFLNFDKNKFLENSILSYQTLDGCTIYNGFKYKMPSGKYSVSIRGYTRREKLDFPEVNLGFYFTFTKVDNFSDFNDPREIAKYNFKL